MKHKDDHKHEEFIQQVLSSGEIPTAGLWYKIVDFSERDYGSDWGYMLFNDGKFIGLRSGFSNIRAAGDAAREAKKRYQREQRRPR